MKAVFYFLLGLIIFIILPIIKYSFAARELSITSNKTSLFGHEDMTITASASGFTNNETIYIKGAFHQDGETNYFGYTKKEDNWIKNSESSENQKAIVIGQWDGTVLVKSDFDDSGFKGEGDYKFKVGFYYTTSGGNLSSINWSSNSLDININEPDPTPTNTPTPTTIPTQTPIPTSTKTPTPTPSSTPTPTKKPLPTSTLGTSKISSNSSTLGKSTASGLTTTELNIEPTDAKDILISNERKNQNSHIPLIFTTIGGIFLIVCAILIFWIFIKNNKQQEN